MAVKIDPNCYYTTSHEWVRVEGDEAWVGITDYAQSQLSDIVYVELPDEGDTFEKGEMFATIESVKAASDIYMPMSGEVVEVNPELASAPEIINQDPYGDGWLIKFIPSDPSELNDLIGPDAYEKFIKEEEEKGGH